MQSDQAVSPNRRSSCANCLRPQSACICQWVTPVAHVLEVLILQHPLEVVNAKGSARLLHLSLPGSRLLTGEVFDVQGLLADPKINILLYPESPQDRTAGQAQDSLQASLAPPLPADAMHKPADLRLIVLDATWRKSRKMLNLNPTLQHLPRLSLNDMPASQYLIRKAHRPDQLSTLEATCAALAQLEGDAEKFAPLLRAFDGFVAQQLGWRVHGSTPELPGDLTA